MDQAHDDEFGRTGNYHRDFKIVVININLFIILYVPVVYTHIPIYELSQQVFLREANKNKKQILIYQQLRILKDFNRFNNKCILYFL